MNQCGLLDLWETKADLEAATTSATAELQQATAAILGAPPTVTVYEVYEPSN
jgi:hypothetical protein